MAAAEYYGPGARPTAPQSASFLAPPQPHRASSNPNITFSPAPPQFSYTPPFPSPQPHATSPHIPPPPPAYGDEAKPNVHFGPPRPQVQHGRYSFSDQRPNPQQWNQYPPPTTQPGRYNPQAYAYQHPPHPAPHTRPYMHPTQSEASLMSGYSSDPEPHRRRHKHPEKRKRRISENSRSTNADGFIGAAGGGLIGDLIFPGFGTAAGALAGWIGGKDYGNFRKRREEKRDREQEEWQMKFGTRDHSNDGRRRSSDHGSDGHKRSHSGMREDY